MDRRAWRVWCLPTVVCEVYVKQGYGTATDVYVDGGAIIEKIKIRRAARRAPPPPRLLEESIDQAPEEIEREKKRGVARFGRQFEEGDHIAVIALQQITIQLQGKLLEKLRSAAFNDNDSDFTYLVDEADLGRDRTITTMLELRQRLMQAQPVHELTPTISGESKQPMAATTRELPPPPGHNEFSPGSQPPRPHRTWTREYSNPRDASGEEDTASGADDSHHTHRKRHSSLLGFLNKHHRSHSGSNEHIPKVVEEVRHQSTSPASLPFRPPQHCDVREPPERSSPQTNKAASQHQLSPSESNPNFTYQEWEDDPAEIWGPGKQSTSQDRRDTISLAPDAPLSSSPHSSTHTHPLRSPSHTPSFKPSSLHHAPTTASVAIPTPTPENDYLGFCKGAWKLQSGDRKGALQKLRDNSNDAWSRTGASRPNVFFLSCTHTKCAFAGNIDAAKIWDRVWTSEARGVKMRWAFLAKSHVTQSKVKDGQFGYRCLFCVFTEGRSGVYFGTDTYLEHVSGVHRGQGLGDVILYKCGAVADRVAEDSEEFDICLYPLSQREAVERRKSGVLADELMQPGGVVPDFAAEKREEEPADSMFSANEPWNEGLSDFHWGGDVERSELA